MKKPLLLLIAALVVAPGIALGGDTTTTGAPAVAGTIGTTAGTLIGGCVPVIVDGVTISACGPTS